MGALFGTVLQMSMTASVVIVVVMLFRLVLRRAPRIFSYMLWAVVLFRLLCPVAATSPVSLFRLAEWPRTGLSRMEWSQAGLSRAEMSWAELSRVQGQTSQEDGALPYQDGLSGSLSDANGNKQPEPGSQGQWDAQSEDAVPHAMDIQDGRTAGRNLAGAGEKYVRDGEKQAQIFHVACIVWLCGVIGMALYGILGSFRFRKTLRGSVRDVGIPGAGICRTKLPAAFVYGLVKPCIYLPEGLLPSEEEYILLHEQIHVKRGDHIWRALGFVALAIHWFNPLVWLAFCVSGRDMEMSCDEAVIRRLGRGRVKEYSDSLLALATQRHILGGAPLAFGEGDTGRRIRNVLRYRKPAVIVTVTAALVCVAVMVALATNPAAEAGEGTEDRQAGNNQAGNNQAGNNQAGNNPAGGNQAEDNQAGNGQAGESLAEGNRVSYDRIPEITLEEKYADVAPDILEGWRTLEWKNEIFTAQDDGIYRTADGRTERIFEGYVGILPNMSVYDGRLFFLVDTGCTSREDFIFYNAIRWIGLDTPGSTGLVKSEGMAQRLKYYYEHLEEEEGMVNFGLSQNGGREGYITVWDGSQDEAYQMLLPVSAKGYRSEDLDAMGGEEQKAYGQELSDWLRQNPGTVQNVSVRTEAETYAWLDLDGDESVEYVSLRPNKGDNVSNVGYGLLDDYILSVGNEGYEGFGEEVTNNLLAVSLDGKEILLALYEDGPSGDPETTLFRYENGRLAEAGSIGNDIRKAGPWTDGRLYVWERCGHLQTDWAHFPYELTADNRLERVTEESYQLAGKRAGDWGGEMNYVDLKVELPVYETPDGAFKLNLTPGTVFFDRIQYEDEDTYWLYVSGYNGAGWFRVEDLNIAGVEMDYQDVFGNLNNVG